MRAFYAFIGALVGAVTNLMINLLAAATQQRGFDVGIEWLIGLTVIGLLLGLWLSATLHLQPGKPRQGTTPQESPARPVTMTRLRALLSYGKLRGQGIALTDIVLVGSVLDIDTRE